MNKLDEAEKLYNGAVLANPGYPEGYFNLGVVCLKKGNKAEAKKFFEKALSLDPAHAKAKEGLKLTR